MAMDHIKSNLFAEEMLFLEQRINRLEKYIEVLADKAGIDLKAIHT